METTSPAAGVSSSSAADASTLGLASRVFDSTVRLATSWIGQLTGYTVALYAAVEAYEKLSKILRGVPWWARALLVCILPLGALGFRTIPALFEQRRKRRLAEISGSLKSGYFSNQASGSVMKFRIADRQKVGKDISTGLNPSNCTFDGNNIWVRNTGSGTVWKIRASDGKKLTSVEVGRSPTGIAFDGVDRIWVAVMDDNYVKSLPRGW